ncbi:MAG: hypothetical protein IT382_20315, partial [Deltaproteobacteria bacterium]|nr:hypothetical protein [Deltaproteobacteria bacterium]
DAVTLLDQLHLGHLESTRHGLTRGAYQVAEAELVEELLRSHRLHRAGAPAHGRGEHGRGEHGRVEHGRVEP